MVFYSIATHRSDDFASFLVFPGITIHRVRKKHKMCFQNSFATIRHNCSKNTSLIVSVG